MCRWSAVSRLSSFFCSALQRCSSRFIRCGELRFLQGWPALPHRALLLYLLSASLTFFSLSQEVQRGVSWSDEEQEAGPAEEKHMSQSSGHQQGPAEPQLCSQPQCSQPGRAHPALSQLLRSVPLTHSVMMCPTRLYNWRGTLVGKKQSSFVLLGCRTEPFSFLSALVHQPNPKNAGYLQRDVFRFSLFKTTDPL